MGMTWSADHGNCWTCGDRPPHRFRYLIHAKARLRWAARMARHAEPKTFGARLRLIWNDFVMHGVLNRGRQLCQDCGFDYDVDWHVNDGDWQRVMGGPSGVLCPSCFYDREKALMATLRMQHCGREAVHDGHFGCWEGETGLVPQLYCDGDPAHLARQREREANPPPGPPAPPHAILWDDAADPPEATNERTADDFLADVARCIEDATGFPADLYEAATLVAALERIGITTRG